MRVFISQNFSFSTSNVLTWILRLRKKNIKQWRPAAVITLNYVKMLVTTKICGVAISIAHFKLLGPLLCFIPLEAFHQQLSISSNLCPHLCFNITEKGK